MIINLQHRERLYRCDLSQPIDISIPVGQVKCFHATDFSKSPYQSGDFVGSIRAGAPVNFFDITLNPHGNGTHTECLGHITEEQESINNILKQFHFIAQLVSVPIEKTPNGDQIISREALEHACPDHLPEVLIIRTLPNDTSKQTKDYSDTNPPYLSIEAMEFIVSKKIHHLLLDLPSVDREKDNGILAAHHLFWNVKDHRATTSELYKTITELIYVPDTILDGLYLLNLQISSIALDAVPSKPVLYSLHHEQ